MSRIVIADTSCLIILGKIDLLEILQSLFSEIWITEEVSKEYGEALPSWIKVKKADANQITKILALSDLSL